MPDGTMPLDTAGRLLRAKAHELENRVQGAANRDGALISDFDGLTADVALVAELLAMALAHIAALQDASHHHTKTGKVLTHADIEALADEAEAGYDVDPPGAPGAVMAQLYFTWEELELLAGLVEGRLGGLVIADPEWGNLNTMRTALREAQYGLRQP